MAGGYLHMPRKEYALLRLKKEEDYSAFFKNRTVAKCNAHTRYSIFR